MLYQTLSFKERAYLCLWSFTSAGSSWVKSASGTLSFSCFLFVIMFLYDVANAVCRKFLFSPCGSLLCFQIWLRLVWETFIFILFMLLWSFFFEKSSWCVLTVLSKFCRLISTNGGSQAGNCTFNSLGSLSSLRFFFGACWGMLFQIFWISIDFYTRKLV